MDNWSGKGTYLASYFPCLGFYLFFIIVLTVGEGVEEEWYQERPYWPAPPKMARLTHLALGNNLNKIASSHEYLHGLLKRFTLSGHLLTPGPSFDRSMCFFEYFNHRCPNYSKKMLPNTHLSVIFSLNYSHIYITNLTKKILYINSSLDLRNRAIFLDK